MKRPEQHQTDERAQQIFKAAIPTAWVVRDNRPDYAIDYTVEIGDAAKEGSAATLSGLTFAVQLKGTTRLKRTRTAVSFSIGADHLKYYVDKYRLPVMLVVVEIESETCYWMFLQEYALEKLAGKNWRAQKTVTVSIPGSQTLADIPEFRKGVEGAEHYMSGLRPSAIRHAFSAEKKRLQSLDPRLEILFHAVDGVVTREIRAKEFMSFTMTFTGDPERGRQFFDDLIGRGVPVDILPGELKVEGSLLMAEAFANAGRIQSGVRLPCTARFSIPGASGFQQSFELPARMEGGMKEIRLDIATPRCPFSFKMTMVGLDVERLTVVDSRLTFKPTLWAGQRFSLLSQFDPLRSVLGDGSKPILKLEVFLDGNRLMSFDADSSTHPHLEKIQFILDVIAKIRETAKYLGIDPIFPSEINEEEFEEAAKLHWLTFPDGYRKPARNAEISSKTTAEGAKNFLTTQTGFDGNGCLRIARGPEPITFMGVEISLDGLAMELTHTKLVKPRTLEEIAQAGDVVKMAFQGTEKSEMLYTKPTAYRQTKQLL